MIILKSNEYNVFYICIKVLLNFYIYMFTMAAPCSVSICVYRIITLNFYAKWILPNFLYF